MGNTITVEQNSERNIRLLSAKTVAYSKAETVQNIQAIIPVLNIIAWPVILPFYPDFKVYAALSGFLLPFIDAIFLDPCLREYKLLGAKIQEVFDCELLKIPPNTLKTPNPPTEELIHEYALGVNSKTEKSLSNWYSFDFSDTPLPIARLICQRANCFWDSKLRRSYSQRIIICMTVFFVLAIVSCIASSFTIEKFVLAVLAPLTPVVLWGAREIRRQKEAADEGERILRNVEAFINDKALSNLDQAVLMEYSRRLQDQIYDRRRNSPVNPSRFYWGKRDDYELLMRKGGQSLIEKWRSESKNKRS